MFGNIHVQFCGIQPFLRLFVFFALFGTFAFEAQECCLGGSQGFILIIAHKTHSSVAVIDTVLKQFQTCL